jgi:hypothetical protein
MPHTKRRREQEHGRGRKGREQERRLEAEWEGQERRQERAPEQEREQRRRRERHVTTRRPSAISLCCIRLRSGRSQGRRRTSTMPPSSTHTTSITTPEHRLRQQSHHPGHAESDTPLRPPIGPSLTSLRDIPSGHDRGTLGENDTHGPGENVLRPSGSGARLYPPEPPALASLPPPHRPPKVERPSSRPQTTITNTNQIESHYSRLTSNLDNNLINRRGDQPVREYSSTTFHSRMDLDFPGPGLKPALIRSKQRTN